MAVDPAFTRPLALPASAVGRAEGTGAPRAAFRGLGHVPALDGVRGIAVLMTVVAHSFFAIAPGGGVTGVALFFVLSGFLITSILVAEWDKTGLISLRRFYARRVLRLGPALAAVLIVYLVLAFASFSPVAIGDRLRSAFFVATYFGNWQNASGSNLAELSHTWSLAVEDQFYFLWPVSLAFLLRSRLSRAQILAVTGVAMGALVLLRAVAWTSGHVPWERIYYGTDMVGSSLLIGCLAGLAFSWGLLPRIPASRAVALVALLILLASCALVSQHDPFGRLYLATIGFPIIAIASAGLIVTLALDRSAGPILGHPVLVYFGRISYALYLWHLLTIQVLGKVLHMASLERSIVSIPIAIALATLSYVAIERPFLRLKRHFEPRTAVAHEAT